MRVRTLTALTETGLDRKINNFLESNSLDVIDIKYSSSLFYMGVLVIYRLSNKE